MTLLQKDEPPVHQPTRAREVFDVTGAGDTVIATLTTALAAKINVVDAMRLANFAAGVVVAKVGTAAITQDELNRAINPSIPHQQKVVTPATLLDEIAKAKAQGKKIVMTNGCFDILHVGHITYLEQAKALGHILVVAVNDDASVKRLKGDTRPVNALNARMEVLAGLSSVDLVAPFSEDTPEVLISAVAPDVLVKGGDWQIHQIAGGAGVLARGGEVCTIDTVEGYSTTKLIKHIEALS
jgi:D-beta-D-heptose 7-phosphate kinase/D-beta-D-heptose 1-phosphate adenosyltransferase